MNALRATRLTWRIHRFEALFGAGVAVLLAATLWVIASHLRAIDVDPACWGQWVGSDEITSACQRSVHAWLTVNEEEVGQMTGLLVFVPILLGVVLGVPVVGREAEMRTLGLAWALEGRRWRWLLARVLPMLVIAVVGGVLLGMASRELRAAQAVSPFELDRMEDIAHQGAVLGARVLLGFGVGLLAGAALGRTLPALLVATVAAVLWVAFLNPTLETATGRTQAVWRPNDQVFTDGGDIQALAYLGGGVRAPDGTVVPDDPNVTMIGGGTDDQGNEYVALVVPFDARPTIEGVDVVVTLGLAATVVLATGVLVARRRPD